MLQRGDGEGPLTFPEASEALLPSNGAVGIHSPAVLLGSTNNTDVCLEAHFHHIGGLGASDRHGSGGAAGKQAGEDTSIWGWGRERDGMCYQWTYQWALCFEVPAV